MKGSNRTTKASRRNGARREHAIVGVATLEASHNPARHVGLVAACGRRGSLGRGVYGGRRMHDTWRADTGSARIREVCECEKSADARAEILAKKKSLPEGRLSLIWSVWQDANPRSLGS